MPRWNCPTGDVYKRQLWCCSQPPSGGSSMATKAEKGRVSIMTKQQKKTLNLVLTYLVIILIGCVLLFPIAWMISAAFKTNDEIFGSIALLPKSRCV